MPAWDTTRRSGALAVAAVTAAVGLVVGLHVLGWATIDPVSRTISDYALIPGGTVLFAAAMACVLLASVALWKGLRTAGVVTSIGRSGSRVLTTLAALWCIGLFLVAVCPTDPPGTPLTLAGAVHRYAAGLVFFTLPPLARGLATHVGRRASVAGTGVQDLASMLRRLSVLSVVSWWCLALFLLSHLPVVLPHTFLASLLAGPYAVLGLAERLLLVVDLAILLVLGRALLSHHTGPSHHTGLAHHERRQEARRRCRAGLRRSRYAEESP